MAPQPKALTWVGWIISVPICLLMTFSAAMKFIQPSGFAEQVVDKLGYPVESMLYIGLVEIACVLVFLVPRTAVLGAVLLTGYLGGAIATHVRIHDNFAGPAIFGVLVWLAIYLRDPRLRELLPLRGPQSRPEKPKGSSGGGA